MPAQPPDSTPTSASRRWLFSPGVDLLTGCGLGYLLVFALLCVAGTDVKALLPLSLLPLLALVAGGPHYGATLLRVYETGEDRKRYAAVALGATLALALAFLVSLRVHALGSLLVTLYLLWSPWHYSAQNYGLARMLLGRRGLRSDAGQARLLRAAFTLPFLLFIVQSNGAGTGSTLGSEGAALVSTPGLALYRSISLGIPAAAQSAAMALLLAGYLLVVAWLGVGLLRRASMRDLAPVGALLGSQALWFALPAVARFFDFGQGLLPLDGAQSLYAFQWVAAAHAVQYLWITLYFNQRSGRRPSKGRFYLKSLLAGQALWTLPTFVFAPLMLGGFAYSADLVVLVAAVVNLHHFVLDGAIWKLRDARIRALLIGAQPGAAPAAPASPRAGARARLVPLAWAAGALVIAVETLSIVDRHSFHVAWAAADLRRAEFHLKRLEALGRDGAGLSLRLARLAEDADEPERAIAAYRRSAEIQPQPAVYQQLARLHLARGEWSEAADALERAGQLAPLSPEVEALRAEAHRRAGPPSPAAESP